MKFYLGTMRTLALIAFFALQLSVFTCGFDIHVHAMDLDMGHITGHLHDKNGNHDQDEADYRCHVHASHTFAAFDTEYFGNVPLASTVQHDVLAELNLKNLPFLIEHPPKLHHG